MNKPGLLSVFRRERGSISVFTALTMIIMIFFVGLALDLSMVLLDKAKLDNLCQVVCEDRYVHDDLVRFSDNPAVVTVDYVSAALQTNGFTGQLEVAFDESTRDESRRVIDVDVSIMKSSPLYFMRIFGFSDVKVSSTVSYEDVYGEGGDDVVWAPAVSASTYNGTYQRVIA